MDTWKLKGELILACSCDVFCPCVVSLGKHPPTEGHCQGWAGIRIDKGAHGKTKLDGLNVALLLDIPGEMGRGDWKAAAFVDERASDEQFDRLISIFSGKSKGSTGVLGILVSTFLGAERAPVSYETDGKKRRLMVGKKIQGEVEPILGARADKDVVISNSSYWIGPEIVVAKANQSRVRAFGRVWDFPNRSAEILAIDWKGP
jgi:hypothetical protein